MSYKWIKDILIKEITFFDFIFDRKIYMYYMKILMYYASIKFK